MKIVDWKNNMSKKFLISEYNSVNDLYNILAEKGLLTIKNTEEVLKDFYAMYVFNTDKDIVIIATTTDNKRFNNLSYYKYGSGIIEKNNGQKVSLIDAGIEFAKTAPTNGVLDIGSWENFYLNNFISEKLTMSNADLEILDEYVMMMTKPNIEIITEGYVDEDSFNSLYLISKEDKNPQVLVVVATEDGDNISNHYAMKIDKNLSFEEYSKILNELMMFKRESFLMERKKL